MSTTLIIILLLLYIVGVLINYVLVDVLFDNKVLSKDNYRIVKIIPWLSWLVLFALIIVYYEVKYEK